MCLFLPRINRVRFIQDLGLEGIPVCLRDDETKQVSTQMEGQAFGMLSLLVSFYCFFIWRLGEKTSQREDFVQKIDFFPPQCYIPFFSRTFMDSNEHLYTNLQFIENLHVFPVSAFIFAVKFCICYQKGLEWIAEFELN